MVDPEQLQDEIVAAVRAGREVHAGDEAALAEAVIARLNSPRAAAYRHPVVGRGLRWVEGGSALGSAALGFTILVGLEQAVHLNSVFGTRALFPESALVPAAILLTVVVVAACVHVIARFRVALAVLALTSVVLAVGFASVELFSLPDPPLALALSFTDPTATVGTVGLAVVATITGIAAQWTR